jgi:hypothetical protein
MSWNQAHAPLLLKSFPKRPRTQSEASQFGGSHQYKQNKTNKLPSFIDRYCTFYSILFEANILVPLPTIRNNQFPRPWKPRSLGKILNNHCQNGTCLNLKPQCTYQQLLGETKIESMIGFGKRQTFQIKEETI